jgi:hypothetical protein
MNLSDLFGGGGASGSPATYSAIYSAAATNSVVTSSPAVLIQAEVTVSTGSIIIYSGANIISRINVGSTVTSHEFNYGGRGVICQQGITITTNGQCAVHYNLI